jgi:hypothetical protein
MTSTMAPLRYVVMGSQLTRGFRARRYIHAAQVLFPWRAEKAETHMFGVAG